MMIRRKLQITGTKEIMFQNAAHIMHTFLPEPQRLEELSQKKNMNSAEQIEYAWLQYKLKMYFQEGVGPVIYKEMIKSVFISPYYTIDKKPAKKFGSKLICTNSVDIVEPFVPLKYKGPRTIKELFEDPSGRFLDCRYTDKVYLPHKLCTRPRFAEWQIDFTVEFEDSMMSDSEVLQFFQVAGEMYGFGSYRKGGYGRFTAKYL